MKTFLAVCLWTIAQFCIFNICSAQSIIFSKAFYFIPGNNALVDIIEFPDSSFLTVGYVDSGSTGPLMVNPFLLHLNKYGDSIFSRRYSASADQFRQIIQHNDTLFFVPGLLHWQISPPRWISLMNETGDTILYKAIGNNPLPGKFAKCKNYGYIYLTNMDGNFNFIRLDSNLNIMWNKGHPFYYAIGITEDVDGGFVGIGYVPNNLVPYQVAKFDKYGTVVWFNTYGNNPLLNNGPVPTSVVLAADSNFLVGLSTSSYDFQLMKVDRNTGDTIWTKNYGINFGIDGMTALPNDRYIAINNCCNIMMFNGNGDTLWTKPTWFSAQTGGWQYGGGTKIIPTLDGGFIYCGRHQITNQTSSMIVVKLDSMGNSQYTSMFDLNNFSSLLFFPNPATTSISISTSSFQNEKVLQFTLIDVNGRVVIQQPYRAGEEINVNSLSDGIYFGEVSGKEKVVRGKVIVQH